MSLRVQTQLDPTGLKHHLFGVTVKHSSITAPT
jgi:hypothetical protein